MFGMHFPNEGHYNPFSQTQSYGHTWSSETGLYPACRTLVTVSWQLLEISGIQWQGPGMTVSQYVS